MACCKKFDKWKSGCKGWKPSVFIVVFISMLSTATGQTIADTFDSADIPTNLGSYSPTCNGPLTKLSITLPPGGAWNVTSIDIQYNMTALGGGFKSHQRSYIHCQNTQTSEDSIYQGTGNSGGIQVYNRTGITIANGNYAGGEVLFFEMRAWRTASGSGCSTANNKVDIFTWIITVHYSQVPDEGSVGIGTTTPATSAILDLTSTTQAFLPPRMTTMQRNAISDPIPGMIIYNTTTQNLELYTSAWGKISVEIEGFNYLFGGSEPEALYDLVATPDGGYIATGYSSSSNTGTMTGLTNNGPLDAWVVKFSSDFTIEWQKLLGGNLTELLRTVIPTADGGYILCGLAESSNTGTLTGVMNHGGWDLWVIKLDEDGNTIWQKLFGGSLEENGYDITQTSDGGYIVIGYAHSTNGNLTGLTNNGMADNWIIKLTPSGDISWQKLYGGSLDDWPRTMTADPNGGFVIAGFSSSSNTGTLTGLINHGELDLWLYKIDNNGNIVWNKLYGGDMGEVPYSINPVSDGGFIIGGESTSSNTGNLVGLTNNGEIDAWIVKTDALGNLLWNNLYGGAGNEFCYEIIESPDGELLSTGFSSSSNSGTLEGVTNFGIDDVYVMKLSSAGGIIWQKLMGGTMGDISRAIIATNDGGCIIGANTESSNSGFLQGLINNGNSDYWFIKLDSDGNPN